MANAEARTATAIASHGHGLRRSMAGRLSEPPSAVVRRRARIASAQVSPRGYSVYDSRQMRRPARWTTVLAVALAAGSPMLSRPWFTRMRERRWVEAGIVASLVVSTVALLGLPTVNVLGLQPTVNVL